MVRRDSLSANDLAIDRRVYIRTEKMGRGDIALTAAGRLDFVSFKAETGSKDVAPALHLRERGNRRVFV
jgi:hypothetical protein